MPRRKIFLTGATGFIGSHVVRRLAGSEHALVCLARPGSRVAPLREAGACLVAGDVTDAASLRTGMAGCEVVIHLANVYDFWTPDASIYTRVNVEGTRHVMACALSAGVEKVVYASTALVYGKPKDYPFNEESQPGPERLGRYAESKYLGDRLAWDFHYKSGLPLVALYPSGVLGAGDEKYTGRYIRNLVRGRLPARAFESAVHNLVHVRDVAEAVVRVVEMDGVVGQKYLLSGERLSIGELNRQVAALAGVRLPLLRLPGAAALALSRLLTWIADGTGRPPLWDQPIDALRYVKEGLVFDGSKAQHELGLSYTPLRVALEEAVASCQK